MTRYEDSERIRTITPGDPVSDYYGFPDIQLKIIHFENTTSMPSHAVFEGMLSISTTVLGEDGTDSGVASDSETSE